MRQNLLRRLSALLLAFVMAASLCVTPAWAAPGPPTFSTQLVCLPKANDKYTVTIYNLAEGDKITWTASSGVTVNDTRGGGTLELDQPGQTSIDISVSATTDTARRDSPGEIKVTAPDGNIYMIYVYCGITPFQINSTAVLPILNVNAKQDLTLTVESDVPSEVSGLISAADVVFSSGSNATAEPSTTRKTGVGQNYTTTITGKRTGTTTITVTITGGFSKTWEITVKKSTDVFMDFMSVNPPNLPSMTVGDTYDHLTITNIVPDKANKKDVTWSTSDLSVATVDPNTGVVKAVGPGRATITATAKDFDENGPAQATCIVVVKEASSNLTLSPNITSKTLYTYGTPGHQTTPSTVTLTATPGGENSDNVTYKWTISRTSTKDVVTLANDTSLSVDVTAKKTGSATVTVTADFYNLPTWNSNRKKTATKTASCTITVLDENSVAVEGVTLNKTKYTMPVDDTITLSVASVTPSNAPVKSVIWDSTDKTVATVDQNGKVTALKAGETAIIARPEFGITQGGVCTVTVTPKAESINLRAVNTSFSSNTPGTNHYFYTFKKVGDEGLKARATFTPSAADDPVRWTSKDPSVATVSGGTTTQATVTAVGPGVTTITAVPLDHTGKDRALSAGPAEIEVTVSGLAIQRTVDGTTSTITSLTLAEGRRQAVTARVFGEADNGSASCDWSSSDPSILMVGTKTGVGTTLTARRPGTVTLTALKGSYTATCSVTVGEDNAVVTTTSTPPGSPLQFSKLASQLQSACSNKTGASLAYVTNLAVASTDQGILHDQHHSSADTGAGVGVQDRYYPGTAPQGQRSLNDLSFVPRNTFNGTAEITYTGWSSNNKSFNGTIRVSVNGTGDVMYSSSEGSAVNFVADDFNLYHPNFRSVSFTPPLDSRGTLYYGYTSASQPGTKVKASDAYYRTGTPSLDRVTFVPASSFTGTVSISYKGTDTAGRSFNGTVTVTVNGGGNSPSPGDIYYPSQEDSWVTFKPADFANASRSTLGETLSYVRFSLPPSGEGTLFYNYRGFGNYDSAVSSTTSYYYSGTPALSGVTFVPTTTTPSQVDIDYTGYTTRGNTFTGTIHIGQVDGPQQGGLRYTVSTGKSVSLNAYDFNTACVAATGASLNYVQFSTLPAVGEGTLRYSRSGSSSYSSVSTSTRCYRDPANTWDVALNNVSFLASSSYAGTVTIPFTGYNTSGASFTGEVVITVTPPTTGDSVYSGTTASPLQLSSTRMRSACNGVLNGTLSYITFTSLPGSTAGKLYQDYSRFGTGTPVNTGTRYYVSGSGSNYPTIDQVSFVPRGRYSGQVTVGYTATNTSGQSVSGILTFIISNTGSSNYFSDMGYHSWAAPAVDYLYRNGVTKGVSSTAYGPDQQILRCDFILMLCRAFNFTGGSGYSFADVPTNAYYADAVATAKQMGIVSGDGRNFMPNSQITRQDAMVMTKNALDAAGWNVGTASTSILSRFPDGTSVAGYARNAVSSLVQLGAVNGDNGRLYPYNPITRAEAAVILHFVMTM